jgi:hypothetical protein
VLSGIEFIQGFERRDASALSCFHRVSRSG